MSGRDGDDTTTGRGDYQPIDNFAFCSLEEEAQGNGWTRITRPSGPGDPPPAPVVGMRGEPDYDSDPSYGPGTQSSSAEK